MDGVDRANLADSSYCEVIKGGSNKQSPNLFRTEIVFAANVTVKITIGGPDEFISGFDILEVKDVKRLSTKRNTL